MANQRYVPLQATPKGVTARKQTRTITPAEARARANEIAQEAARAIMSGKNPNLVGRAPGSRR